MHRIVTGLVAVALTLAACGQSAPRVGADAGPLDTVTSAATAPGATEPPAQGTDPEAPGTAEPQDPTDPSEQPTEQPTDAPSDTPSDTPSDVPSDPPSDQPSESPSEIPPPPPDLELDGWDVRVVGIIDPARANVLNVFRQRPVVVVFHAQADAVDTSGSSDPESTADAAAIVDVVEVDLVMDTGQGLDQVRTFTGHTTVECPAQVEARVVLRAGQGQRLCAVFDVPATREVDAVELSANGVEAVVDRADITEVEDGTALEVLDIGVPQGMLALGEVVDVVVDSARGDATVGMAVTEVEVLDETDDRLIGITVELTAPEDVTGIRLDPEAIAAIAPDGTQRGRLLDAGTSGCRGTGLVDVQADEVVSVCVPVLVPADAITSHARFTRTTGPPQVWRVLEAGGTAGPGSNA